MAATSVADSPEDRQPRGPAAPYAVHLHDRWYGLRFGAIAIGTVTVLGGFIGHRADRAAAAANS